MKMRISSFCFIVLAQMAIVQAAFADSYLIKNAQVVTMSSRGILRGASVLVRDGFVERVGFEIDVDDSVTVIDAKGGYLTPGLFDSGTQLGLAEVNNFTKSTDNRVKGMDLGAGFTVALALNRYSSFVPMVRQEGITRAMVIPVTGSEVIAGQSAIIQLGETGPFITNGKNAVHVYLREVDKELVGGSRASALYHLMNSLSEAQRYLQNIRAYQSGKTRDFQLSEADLKALQQVLTRNLPLVIHVDRAADIETIIRSLSEFELRIVLAGAREAWKVKDLIRDENIPVLINVIDNIPSRFDRLGARLDNAALLTEAGVKVAFMTQDLYTNTRSLTQAAGIAVAYGLPWEESMKAITTNPASIWGIEHYGSLEPGSLADLVIWDGDPLEVMSAPTRMMIDGAWVSLKSRQDLLRDRYSNLGEKEIPFGYR